METSSRCREGRLSVVKLSADLRLRHSRGFSRSNLTYMRLLYLILRGVIHAFSNERFISAPLTGQNRNP